VIRTFISSDGERMSTVNERLLYLYKMSHKCAISLYQFHVTLVKPTHVSFQFCCIFCLLCYRHIRFHAVLCVLFVFVIKYVISYNQHFEIGMEHRRMTTKNKTEKFFPRMKKCRELLCHFVGLCLYFCVSEPLTLTKPFLNPLPSHLS
jgi:hypothetical protein